MSTICDHTLIYIYTSDFNKLTLYSNNVISMLNHCNCRMTDILLMATPFLNIDVICISLVIA